MSHGIDICRCGAVVMQCRCIGPHTSRVVCETCDVCRSRHEPQTATPVPTTASAHQAMVEALRRVSDTLATADNPHNLGTDRWTEWHHQRVRDLAEARAAVVVFEKRPPLRHQVDLKVVVFRLLAEHDATMREEKDFSRRHRVRENTTDAVLDALEPLLYGTGPRTGGERG